VVEIIPLWLVNVLSFITSVMAAIGTTITPSASIRHLRSPSLLVRGLVSVLVIVPVIGFATTIALGLALPEQVGVVLMAIAPGAPLALRRALASGADEGFAPTLQIAVAILAVPVVPLWVVVGNWILGTHGFIDTATVARQVILAQLLPLAMGTIVKRVAPLRGARIGIALGRAGAILLIAALVSILVNVRYSILLTHFWPIVCVAIITIAALVVHLLGGPSPEIRHAMAIAGALRNVGLALLVATTNQTQPVVEVVIISYVIIAIMRRWSQQPSGSTTRGGILKRV
jgi:BASS family bile acid:Na+ symporter